jgi:hypothetical protein
MPKLFLVIVDDVSVNSDFRNLISTELFVIYNSFITFS